MVIKKLFLVLSLLAGSLSATAQVSVKEDEASKPDKYPMASWYHKPSDEYREDWDLTGTVANVNLVFSVALSLACFDQ